MGVEQGGNWHAYDRLPAVRRTRCRCEMRARNARPEVLGPGRRISRGRCAGGAGAATPPSVRAVLSNNIVSGVGPCGAAALRSGTEPSGLLSLPGRAASAVWCPSCLDATLQYVSRAKFSQSQCYSAESGDVPNMPH